MSSSSDRVLLVDAAMRALDREPELVSAFFRAAKFRSRYTSLPESINAMQPWGYALEEALDGYEPSDGRVGTIDLDLLVGLTYDHGLFIETVKALSDSEIYGFFDTLYRGQKHEGDRDEVALALLVALHQYVQGYRENLSGDMG